MKLYSGITCPFSHGCRIVIREKALDDLEIIDIDPRDSLEHNFSINPHGRIPVLIDRDVALYEPHIINEFLDERYPVPQLVPADLQMRAKARQMLFTMRRELFSHIPALEKNLKTADTARAHVRDRLNELAPIFVQQKFVLGAEFSIIDASLAPLLWRLDHYGITLGKSAAPLLEYAESVFSRPGFIAALTPSERAIR